MGPKTKGKAQKDVSKQKQSQVKPVIMTEENEEKSRTHKKMITNQQNIKTKVVQKNDESEQQEFNENKGSNRSRKSWSQLDLQNINDSNAQKNTQKQSQRKITSRIESTITTNKKIPPFAQLILDTILKIAEYPKKQELEKASLVDQICSMIESTSAKYKKEYFEQVESKIEKLLGLFTKGIERGQVFEQQRIKYAANQTKIQQNKENIITFHPTHTVTGQIMRQLILGQIKKYQISFGHYGIAKTFAHYLYHQLSNMFISQVINQENSVVRAFLNQKSANLQFRDSQNQKLLLNIPKLIYWSMQIYENNNKNWLENEIKSVFLTQCQEIREELMGRYQDLNLFLFVDKICKLYRNKGIIVYLMIDQMNKIASCFRDFFIIDEKVKYNPILKESLQYKDKKSIYQSAKTLNDFRYSLLTIKKGFHRVFYNSSANLEAISKIDQSSQQQVYKKIKQSLKLQDRSSHDEPVYETSRVFYPEIINLESTIWSLTDTIIFEVKKFNWFLVKDQKEMQKLREKIFIHLRDRSSNTVLTFLRIRLAVKDAITKIQRQKITIKNVDQIMKAILQIAQEKQKQQLDEKLKSFIGKVTKKEQRLYAIAQVYNFMHEKLQTQGKLSTIKTTETKMKELAFLENPICLEKTQTLLLNNLDRHLFLFFKNNDQFRKFFYSFKKLLKQNLSSWLGKKYNGEEVDKYLQQLQKDIQNKNRNSYELGFSFLSPENVISLLKPKIRQLSQLRKEDYTKILRNFTASAFDSVLEGQLVEYLKQTKQQVNFQCFKYQNMNQFKNLIQLPKQKAELGDATQNLQANKSFMLQFLGRNQKKQIDYHYYVPSTPTSKSIDFVIKRQIMPSGRNQQFHQVFLCQVTLLKNISKMKEKIDVFLNAYNDVEESFTQKDFENYFQKVNSKKKTVQLSIYFVVIGGEKNDTPGLKKYIIDRNSQIKKKDQFLRQIRFVKFNDIELPNCGQFFRAMKDIIKEKDIPQK